MKSQTRAATLLLFATFCVALALPAVADETLYSNGAYNGQLNAYSVSNGDVVSNGFALGKAAQIKAISMVAWVFPSDTFSSIGGSLSSGPDSGFNYVAFVTSKSGIKTVSLGVNEFGYDLEQVTFSIPGTDLDAGSYWLNLQNAMTDQGDPVFWDENDGPSQAFSSSQGAIGSESFTISGGDPGGTTPEPSSLALFGSGALALAGVLRRRFLE